MGGGSEGGGVYFVCSQPCRLPAGEPCTRARARARGRRAIPGCPRRGKSGAGRGCMGPVRPGPRSVRVIVRGWGSPVGPECLSARRGVVRARDRRFASPAPRRPPSPPAAPRSGRHSPGGGGSRSRAGWAGRPGGVLGSGSRGSRVRVSPPRAWAAESARGRRVAV